MDFFIQVFTLAVTTMLIGKIVTVIRKKPRE